MKTYKKYTIFQSYKVVALKLSLPCPFESQNSKGRGRHNFWATTLKLWKNEYFLRVFKSYYYHFFIFLLDSDLEKTLLSQTSIAWGVLGFHKSYFGQQFTARRKSTGTICILWYDLKVFWPSKSAVKSQAMPLGFCLQKNICLIFQMRYCMCLSFMYGKSKFFSEECFCI